MSITELKHVSKGVAEPVRRLEIFTGSGRRRSWTADEKATIVAESDAGPSVCAVARRHGLMPSQLFTWRREARLPAETSPQSLFVEAVVDPVHAREEPAPSHPRTSRKGGSHPLGGVIEVEIDGVMVRVGRGAEPKTIAAVLRALKRTS